MRTSRAALAATVLAGSVVVAFGTTATPASAAAARSLDVDSVYDVVVDGVHQRIFISDPENGQIVATDYDGIEVARQTALPGVRGLTLSADSATLYAAVAGSRSIVTFATPALSRKDSIPLGDKVAPVDVTPVGDRLWFGYDHGDDYINGSFGSVDASGAVHLHELAANEIYYSPPSVYASPAAPGVLVVSDTDGISVGPTQVYDVSSGAESLISKGRINGTPDADFAFTPDGSELIQLGDGVARVKISDYSHTSVYPGVSGSVVDVAADGQVAIGGGSAVHVFDGFADKPEWTVTLPEELAHQGLAWEPGSDRVFAVTRNWPGGGSGWDFTLRSVTDPGPATPTPTPSVSTSAPTPTVTAHAPATGVRGKPLTITGTVTDGTPGESVTIARADPFESNVGTATITAAGTFSFTDTPATTGQIRYRALYQGVSSDSVIVAVSLPATTLTLDRNKSIFEYGTTVAFTATLGATKSNRQVELWIEEAGSDTIRLLKKGTVNSAGKFGASLRLTRNTTVTAKFTGDDGYAARSVTSVVYTKVKVSTSISKQYKTKKIGSKKYYYFRTSKDPRFMVVMTAYRGRWHRIVVQRYKGGKWQAYSAQYFPVDDYGRSYLTFTGSYPAGSKWRVRSEYIRGKGDDVNWTTYEADWKYFTYTK
jgi:hypothetical protein